MLHGDLPGARSSESGRQTVARFLPSCSRRRGLCVLVEEFELDAQHVVEALAALVDVVAAAAVAMELAAGVYHLRYCI